MGRKGIETRRVGFKMRVRALVGVATALATSGTALVTAAPAYAATAKGSAKSDVTMLKKDCSPLPTKASLEQDCFIYYQEPDGDWRVRFMANFVKSMKIHFADLVVKNGHGDPITQIWNPTDTYTTVRSISEETDPFSCPVNTNVWTSAELLLGKYSTFPEDELRSTGLCKGGSKVEVK